MLPVQYCERTTLSDPCRFGGAEENVRSTRHRNRALLVVTHRRQVVDTESAFAAVYLCGGGAVGAWSGISRSSFGSLTSPFLGPLAFRHRASVTLENPTCPELTYGVDPAPGHFELSWRPSAAVVAADPTHNHNRFLPRRIRQTHEVRDMSSPQLTVQASCVVTPISKHSSFCAIPTGPWLRF